MGLIKSLVVGVFAVIILSGCAGDGTFKHVLHDSDSLYTEERMMTIDDSLLCRQRGKVHLHAARFHELEQQLEIDRQRVYKNLAVKVAIFVCLLAMLGLLSSRLLVTTDLSIIDISAKAGFSNPSVFSRYFSRKFQISPTQYRRTNSEDDL